MDADLVRYCKNALTNYFDEWEMAQRRPESPMSAKELFAGVGGKGEGISAKDTRRHGRTQILVEDMGPDSEKMHRVIKSLTRVHGRLLVDILTYWVRASFNSDIAHTTYVSEKGPIHQQEFTKHFLVAWSFVMGWVEGNT